jgi:hypothetical protein
MLGEIDKDFYCSAGFYMGKGDCLLNEGNGYTKCVDGVVIRECQNRHRKFPTPDQYREEYGKIWDGAVYYNCSGLECDTECDAKEWTTEVYGCLNDYTVICACTPFGKPPAGWRP